MPKVSKEAMLDFLQSGIRMMQNDSTRELLKDTKAVPHAGQRLIELQRAGWAPLGFDADVGCKALDEIDCTKEGNKDLLAARQEFMFTAMRTYLQALKDRRPGSLEKKRPLPRAVILEFFDACNTRMDLPETRETLLTYLAQHGKVPNEVIIKFQTDLLEDLGFEKDHGCAMLSRITQDFPKDPEIAQKMQVWMKKASQTCMSAVKAHQEGGGQLPQTPMMPMVDKELTEEMQRFIAEARESVAKMSVEEKKSFMNEKTFKKMQVFQNLPPEGRVGYVKRLGDDEKVEFMKTQMIAVELMRKEWEAGQPGGPSCTKEAMQGPAAAPSQEQMM
ncbi:unnamed protein product [Effrenium voratum]|uniref:Uncharacterized protein n=2 Tax=Effrenium voratum TaxID=2562239 RepID=A0AA36I5K1_9DINO|nr:unnamed protein product [Effrenium voratum]CAJ1436053.1 unnamed protein product [Effrenium voratum]